MKLIFKSLVIYLVFISIVNAQPSAPENLSAETVKFQIENNIKYYIKLNWDKVFDSNENQVPLYNIYRKDGNIADNNEFILKGSVLWNTSYLDNSVEVGKTYSYFVTAKNEVESNGSDTLEITVTDNNQITKSASISGKITDESTSEPIAGVYVTLIPVISQSTSSMLNPLSVLTDMEGNYKIKAMPGKYKLNFKPMMNYYAEFYNNVKHVWEADTISLSENDSLTNMDAELTPINDFNYFTLSGNVSDSMGNPINAIIKILEIGPHNSPGFHSNAKTNNEGNFTAYVREGAEVLIFAQPMDENFMGEFFNDSYAIENATKVKIDNSIDNINFVLASKNEGKAKISGNAAGSDVKNVQAMIVAIKLGVERFSKNSSTRAFTDSLGNYSFSNLTSGKYILFGIPENGYIPTFYKADGSITGRWKNADTLNVTDNSDLTDINFTFKMIPDTFTDNFAQIYGKILDSNKNPVSNALISIYNQNNEIINYSFSNQNGEYSIDGLTQGIYKLVCDGYTYSSDETSDFYVNLNEQNNVDFTLNSETVVNVDKNNFPDNYELYQNYPNPFNPTTQISFSILNKSEVNLIIYNILGQQVKVLVNKQLNPGKYNYQFDASNLASGIYLYKLKTNDFEQTKKMLLLK